MHQSPFSNHFLQFPSLFAQAFRVYRGTGARPARSFLSGLVEGRLEQAGHADRIRRFGHARAQVVLDILRAGTETGKPAGKGDSQPVLGLAQRRGQCHDIGAPVAIGRAEPLALAARNGGHRGVGVFGEFLGKAQAQIRQRVIKLLPLQKRQQRPPAGRAMQGAGNARLRNMRKTGRIADGLLTSPPA